MTQPDSAQADKYATLRPPEPQAAHYGKRIEDEKRQAPSHTPNCWKAENLDGWDMEPVSAAQRRKARNRHIKGDEMYMHVAIGIEPGKSAESLNAFDDSKDAARCAAEFVAGGKGRCAWVESVTMNAGSCHVKVVDMTVEVPAKQPKGKKNETPKS